MKKKNYLFCGALLLCVGLFSGCAGAIDLTEEESDLIARYAAGALLNQTEDYANRLVKDDKSQSPELSQSPSPSPASASPEVSASPEASETPEASTPPVVPEAISVPENTEPEVKSVAMDEIYKLKGISFEYTGYEFCTEYTKKSSAFEIVANKEEVLCVAKFKVKNNTSKTKSVNLIGREISYFMNADDSEYRPTISMLENGGLNFLKTKIKSGKSEEAVLVYSVPRKVKEANNLSIHIKEGEQESLVQLK